MRILDSIEKLKYIPNASARSLKSQATNRIGVILSDIDNTYHTEIFKGVSAYLQRHGYTISVAFSNNSPDIECEKIDDFVSQNVSSLVIITCQPQNTAFFRNRIKNYGIPSVFLERRPADMDVSFLGFDNYNTLRTITGTLLQKGYLRIVLITGFSHFSSEKDSIDGYCSAFCEQGLCTDGSLILSTDMSKEDAFKNVMPLGLCSIQAVISTSESIASGVLEAFYVQGIRPGKDIQLIRLAGISIRISLDGWDMRPFPEKLL